jgi:hypothetical protein
MKSIKKELNSVLERTIYDVIYAKVWNGVRRNLKEKVWSESNIAGVIMVMRNKIDSKTMTDRLRWI